MTYISKYDVTCIKVLDKCMWQSKHCAHHKLFTRNIWRDKCWHRNRLDMNTKTTCKQANKTCFEKHTTTLVMMHTHVHYHSCQQNETWVSESTLNMLNIVLILITNEIKRNMSPQWKKGIIKVNESIAGTK